MWKYAALMVAAVSGCSSETPTLDSVRKDVAANLPVGSSVDQVVAYLNKAGHGDTPGKHSAADLQDNAKNGHLGANPETFDLVSIIRNVRKVFPVKYDITLKFIFDRQKRLKSVEIKEVGTGP
jgi:hypothetical protein